MGARLLKIPEDVVASLRMPPDEIEDELHKSLALVLYPQGSGPLWHDSPAV